MLKNELSVFDRLIFDQTTLTVTALAEVDIAALCNQVQDGWLDAILSGMPRDCLIPYFCYQLKRVSEISDTLQLFAAEGFSDLQSGLLSLIDHLRDYYADYLNSDCNAPISYHWRLTRKLSDSVGIIRACLRHSDLNPVLFSCIEEVLEEAISKQPHIRYTFRSLDYIEAMIKKMALIPWEAGELEETLVTFLIQINYNHLSFFNYLRHEVLEKEDALDSAPLFLEYLQTQRANLMAIPQQPMPYAPFWPSIKSMIGDWFQEQIKLAETRQVKIEGAIPQNTEGRLTLHCSVASLACLIKLLYELGIFGSRSLTSVFAFCAAHFNTPKQSLISSGSLSKEYYSINQHTAERIKVLLQNMISWLNRNFFPVWVVIGIIIGAAPGNQ